MRKNLTGNRFQVKISSNPWLESRSERSFHLVFVVFSFITAGSGVEIIVGASFKP